MVCGANFKQRILLLGNFVAPLEVGIDKFLRAIYSALEVVYCMPTCVCIGQFELFFFF